MSCFWCQHQSVILYLFESLAGLMSPIGAFSFARVLNISQPSTTYCGLMSFIYPLLSVDLIWVWKCHTKTPHRWQFSDNGDQPMDLPSGQQPHSYGQSPFLRGKSTVSMAIFNSYVTNNQRVCVSFPWCGPLWIKCQVPFKWFPESGGWCHYPG